MTVKGRRQRLDVLVGPNYRAVVIWAPQPERRGGSQREFHLLRADGGHHRCAQPGAQGLYQELQSIPPGQTWQESFWVRPSGF